MRLNYPKAMKKHEIFPIEIFTFERPDLVDPILDALDQP